MCVLGILNIWLDLCHVGWKGFVRDPSEQQLLCFNIDVRIRIDIWWFHVVANRYFKLSTFKWTSSCRCSIGQKLGHLACLPLFDKQIVDPMFDVLWVVAVARSVNSSHLTASHDSYYLQCYKQKFFKLAMRSLTDGFFFHTKFCTFIVWQSIFLVILNFLTNFQSFKH